MSGSLSYYHSYPSRGGGGGGGGSSAFSTDNMSHRYISRGLPEDSSGGTYHSLSYAHSLITTPFYGVDQSYDDATDHGGRKMGGDKSSARDRLTQSYHTHQTHYTRPRQPYYTYHPPVTTPPLHRTNSGYSSSPSHYRSSHGNGYHDDRLNSYHDERRRDLTTTVSFPQSQGSSARGLSYDWLTHSWSQSMSPKPHPSPLSTPLDSPSDPHPDSSPPTTINHRSVASVTANSAHSLAIRSALPTSATHSCASHSKGTPYIDIISHPEDVMIPPNAKSFELVCEARVLHSNESPLYQWYKDEEPLIGEVGGSLVREVMCEEDTGFYFCIVSDSGGVTQRKSRQAYVCMDDEGIVSVLLCCTGLLCVCVYFSLSLSLCLSLCISLYLFLCLSLSLFLCSSFPLSPSLAASLPLFLARSLYSYTVAYIVVCVCVCVHVVIVVRAGSVYCLL